MLTITKREAVFATIFLALYWILTLWGIWTKDVSALGWNLTVFVVALLCLYTHAGRPERPGKREYVWLVPLLLIAVSYTLYENPYIKAVNMLVLPLLFVAYFIITSTRHHERVVWNSAWIWRMVERALGFVKQIEPAISATMHALIPGGKQKSDLIKRIVIGLAILIFVSLVLFIPLLSGADAAFAAMVQSVQEFVLNLIALETLLKIVVFVVLTVLILAGLLQWTKEEEFLVQKETKHMDAVVSGIVLGGILVLYVLFLFTQLKTLWVYQLPEEFLSTERLVKSGFWQLFFLSGINVLLYVLYYRRTSKPVQNLLTVFMFASLLLLLSATKRMGMYVFYYGFSYEKFFAAYTVVFAIFLFIRLIAALFQKEKTDIVRYLVVAFVWMYAVATVLPVEQIIFRANRALALRPDSRLDMNELVMLSADVFSFGKEQSLAHPDSGWTAWVEEKTSIAAQKHFYEKTLTDLIIGK
ncbi:MAG: DUF4173 domain-containing protein [Candidatus Peribacteraceae bacterium]|nr:DUF4173 domain-containing protein [Candidatus Peribacteraceae bacterium]MDD5739880.1 DUF4173 domain-containing protein [Candidatus Peribacteraceae bacterium]